jgi:heat shock protein HtpX
VAQPFAVKREEKPARRQLAKEIQMNTLKTTFLMTFLTVIVIKVGRALGGAEGALIALAIALVVHAINYWLIDKIILRMHGAKEIRPDGLPGLYRTVQDLTCRAQMPMPKFYLLPRRTATAFATGRDEKHAAVAVTQDIQKLDEAKLESLLARELFRLKNRDRLGGTITASVTGAISALVTIGR